MTRTKAFRSIAAAVVPEASSLSAAGWSQLIEIVEAALAKRPPAVRRQLFLFLKILDLLSLLRHGRVVSALSSEQRAAFLSRIENSRLLLFRRGFWGLRTLVFMGYYARAGLPAELGYAADARGWQLRR